MGLFKNLFLCGTNFKVFIEFVTILLLFYVLVFWPWGMWDLRSPKKDWTRTPRVEKERNIQESPQNFNLMQLYIKLFTTKAEGKTWSMATVWRPAAKMPLLIFQVPSCSLSPREKDTFLKMPSFNSPLRFKPSFYYAPIVLQYFIFLPLYQNRGT